MGPLFDNFDPIGFAAGLVAGAIAAGFVLAGPWRAALRAGRLAEARLAALADRNDLILRFASDGVFDIDLAHGPNFISPRFLEIMGVGVQDDLASVDTWMALIVAEDLAAVREALVSLVGGDSQSLRMTFRIRKREGALRWIAAQAQGVKDAAGHVARVIGSVTDITDRRRAEHQLLHDALHDKLTGLPNRVQFIAAAGDAIDRQAEDGGSVTLFHLGLDRLRHVNEDLGHGAGDRVLTMMARRLAGVAGEQDPVARLGGDEFAVLIEGLNDTAEIDRVLEFMLAELQAPMDIDGVQAFTTVSIGVATHRGGDRQAEDLLSDAQLATQRAKEAGRARAKHYDPAMRQGPRAGLATLGTELRQGVAREEFELHYQPLVRLSDGAPVGFEALIRWRHPRRGLVGPHEFIDLLEETGLIERVGRWCFETACRQLADWRARLPQAADLWMSVNVSTHQLSRDRLVPDVAEILTASGLPARALKIEVTESLVMADPERAASLLGQFRDLGVGLAIDDFGTGYSSLSYLQRFPFETLKIDRSFISGPGGGAEAEPIVQAIVQLGKSLAMQIVAEGVETDEQAASLRGSGCDVAQGYHFAKPMPPEAIEAWLVEGPGRAP